VTQRHTDHPFGAPLEIATVRAQLGDLEAELAEYVQLRSGMVRSFEAGSIHELAVAMVMARIAKGWSQRRLAEELGVAEQQIQRYEATGYASASLARLCDVVAALGVDVHEVVSLPVPTRRKNKRRSANSPTVSPTTWSPMRE
jgi:HTH-type transcriptional regulator/antitoxin HigA